MTKKTLFTPVGEKQTGKTKLNITWKFWKDNKIDQEYTLTTSEVLEKFTKWMDTKEDSWLSYYGYQPHMLQLFIGAYEEKGGLWSVGGESDSGEDLWEVIRPFKNAYFKDRGIK